MARAAKREYSPSYASPRETTNFTTDSFPGVTLARSPRSAYSFTFDDDDDEEAIFFNARKRSDAHTFFEKN